MCSKGSVMLLWLQYLKQLELESASARVAERSPGGAAASPVKTMCEDEEWGNESEAMPGEPRTPSSGASVGERAASSGAASPASDRSAPAAASPPPRLRLNTSLATDPALAPRATPLKRSPSPPAATPSPAPPPPPPADYLALSAAAAAFPGLFDAAAAAAAAVAAGLPPYVCQPCGIRYSSLSTLQAHQEHYCTNRRPPTEPAGTPASDAADDSSGDCKTPRVAPKQYACTYCSYSADKKVSLNRHMRMHSSSPVSAAGTPAPHNGDAEMTVAGAGGAGGAPGNEDRYCTDCDIRFSSIKTYRAHKAHYCRTRQVVKQAHRGGSATSGSAPPSPGATPPAVPPHYALALPTNPILVVPFSLLRGASTLTGPSLPDPDTPCFLLPNGTFQPLGRALPADGGGKEPEVLKAANRREAPRDAATPLDLSVRRSPDSAPPDDHEKENRVRSATPEQIVCAPSLPGSPVTPSPSRRSSSPSGEASPKRRRRDSRGPTPKPLSVPSPPEEKFTPAIHPPPLPPALALRLASEMPIATTTPQVLVKQGVSKCKECNIVFCKYENYRIHKRQYCSAGGGDERASPAPPEPGRPPQYRQLICVNCNINFSSLDNLATHQTYYCTKRETRSPRAAPEVARSGAGAGAEGGWKCPCCDAVSATAAAAQRHLEAHGGVKAFRCTICRYRGNTLRGMRTHIRMHFPKKPADLQEESYISCVVEEDNRETTSPSPAGERIHRCSSCAYTSTYRGNVVRHARLVHASDEPETEVVVASPEIPDIKKEPETEPEETPNFCKSCNISFKYVNTFKAHKQFYCTANNEQANNNVPAAPVL